MREHIKPTFNKNNNVDNNSKQPFRRTFPRRRFNQNSQHSIDHDHQFCGHSHSHDFYDEFFCHLPFAFMALVISFGAIIIFYFLFKAIAAGSLLSIFNQFFHMFHYIHIYFAGTLASVVCFRFSSLYKIPLLIFSSLLVIMFCTLSDSVLPFFMTQLISKNIAMHLCIFCYEDLKMVFIFLISGIITGYGLYKGNKENLKKTTSTLHFFHVFVNALSALFYIISHGFLDWYLYSGYLLVLLFIAIFVPCTILDFILPYTVNYIVYKKNNVYSPKR